MLWIEVPPGWRGAAISGPYLPLRAGNYSVSFDVERLTETSTISAGFDVVWGDGCTELARASALAGGQISVEFTLQEPRFGVQFRCIARGGEGFRVRRGVVLVEKHRGGQTLAPAGSSNTNLITPASPPRR